MKIPVLSLKQLQEIVSHRLALPIGGFLAGAIFSTGLSEYALVIVLLPLLVYLCNTFKTDTYKRTLMITLHFFVPFYGMVLYWFFETQLESLTQLSTIQLKVVSVVCWLIMVFVMSVASALPLLLFKKTINKSSINPVVYQWVLIPSIFVVIEWLRSIAFGAFLYGPEGTIGDNWNFGSFGLAAMNTLLAPIASLVGLYGMTIIIVLLAISLHELIFKRALHVFLTTIVSVALLVLVSVASQNLGRERTLEASLLNLRDSVLTVQPETIVTVERQAQKDIILLPEYSDVFTIEGSAIVEAGVNRRLGTDGISIDVDDGSGEEWYGTIQIRDNQGTKLASQTKEFLIPTGEYLPYFFRTVFTITGNRERIIAFEQNRDLRKGDPPEVFEGANLRVGPIACSGILSREAYRTLARGGAEVLTNSASLTIFNGSRAYFDQSLMMARFHAVANQRAFLQATREAPVFAINHDGTFAYETSRIESGFVDTGVITSTAKTPYTILGEWTLVLSITVLLAITIMVVRKKRSGTYNT